MSRFNFFHSQLLNGSWRAMAEEEEEKEGIKVGSMGVCSAAQEKEKEEKEDVQHIIEKA